MRALVGTGGVPVGPVHALTFFLMLLTVVPILVALRMAWLMDTPLSTSRTSTVELDSSSASFSSALSSDFLNSDTCSLIVNIRQDFGRGST